MSRKTEWHAYQIFAWQAGAVDVPHEALRLAWELDVPAHEASDWWQAILAADAPIR